MNAKYRFSAFGAYCALAVGVAASSTGAIFSRCAQQEASSLTIAAYRMGFAFVVVLIPTLIKQRRELLSVSYRDLGLGALSGFFLAVHFAAWIYSLELTSVAISVVLVNTAPLWVGLLTPLLTHERLSRATTLGIVLSVLGAAVIGCGFGNIDGGSNNPVGAAMAVLGAIGMAGYLLIGRGFRKRHPLGVYVTICYGAAAAFLALTALCTGQQMVGFSAPIWIYLISMALVCQIIGHTTNNWALRFFSASMVAVALLGEPVFSAMLAWLAFGETITLVQLCGSALNLAGIYAATRVEKA